MKSPLVALALLVPMVACSPAQGSPTPTRMSVVTSTTVFADLVAHVGGDRVTVRALVPRGADVHTFDPAPSDAQAVSAASLIVMNGLGLDDWLAGIVRDAGASQTPLLRLAEALPGAELIGNNPHLWLDVSYARGYASLIASQLIQLDPQGKTAYEANLAAYDRQLRDLDAWITEQFAPVPPDDRRVVSFHDAFPYFARAYGLEIVGVIVPAPGQEPSAGEVAALIDAIRGSGARAILAEAQFDQRLVDTIANETGARVVSDLYDDSLGDPPLESYDEIMRWDTNQLVQVLR